ncbi:hypothetical protein POSPLADRAFT_1038600 [Postia placenta MAD-698-R-SB12]|uniref:Uncharacterized protein n=1 Tax=Postia placenta MAD-698-R-SB12 TaxID=670580 RepID=A0A1X6NCM0_9APHY|nr:hypothetical protein POSPLADRAFT_1038600 [Postia placenta MAD-698-R-SB12]OSX66385.1 hypothetical protein POSPLADRAFT_1038600 [Postia placenta MAD-698-R-SB12]
MAAVDISPSISQPHVFHHPTDIIHPANLDDAPLKVDTTTTPAESSATRRDPHILPTFPPDAPPSSPILYLPPILSLLPPEYVQPLSPSPSDGLAPLSTDSHLPSIDEASLALHRALHHFRPVTSEYAYVPYASAFNWHELELPESIEFEWYCVMFRSRRREGSDSGPLYEADRKAHEEAVQNGGLLLYWYGTPHPDTRMNLATCIWQSRAHALAANGRPDHIRAMRLAAASYEHWELQRYWLRKVKGEKGVTIHSYDGTSRT